MMKREIWTSTYDSGAIAAGDSQTFGNEQETQAKRRKYGSANRLIASNLADEEFLVELDGYRTFAILQSRSTVIIEPDDGIYFDSVKISNQAATNADANEVRIVIARVEEVMKD